MNKRLLLAFLLPLQFGQVFSENDRAPALGEISLEQFNMDRVVDARAHYKRRMRHVQYALWGILGGVGAVTVVGLGVAHVRNRPSVEQTNLQRATRQLGAVNTSAVYAQAPATTAPGAPPAQPPMSIPEFQALTNQVNALAQAENGQTGGNQEGLLSGWSSPIKLGLALGVAGVVMTIGTQILHVVAGTLEELISLWVRGYQYWYNALEQEVKTTFAELRDSLNQARKIASSGFDSGVLKGPGRRYASQTRAVGTHYRADITTMYQVGLGKLERLVALMYLMAPEENHSVIHRHISKLSGMIEHFRDSLQYDLNENTHGTLTHYSNRTMELFQELDENIQILLTTYRVYLTN